MNTLDFSPSKSMTSNPDDKIVRVWRPSPADKTPPFPTNAKDCFFCAKEQAAKEIWNPAHGSADEWLEILSTKETAASMIDWWESVSQIRWEQKDDLKLCTAYLLALANRTSLDVWGRTISRQRLGEIVPLKKEPADEDWFRNLDKKAGRISRRY